MTEAATSLKRTLVGRVVSNKMDKTVTVLIERQEKHPLYGKYVTRSTKLKAHDENNDCRIGDLVTIRKPAPWLKPRAGIWFRSTSARRKFKAPRCLADYLRVGESYDSDSIHVGCS